MRDLYFFLDVGSRGSTILHQSSQKWMAQHLYCQNRTSSVHNCSPSDWFLSQMAHPILLCIHTSYVTMYNSVVTSTCAKRVLSERRSVSASLAHCQVWPQADLKAVYLSGCLQCEWMVSSPLGPSPSPISPHWVSGEISLEAAEYHDPPLRANQPGREKQSWSIVKFRVAFTVLDFDLFDSFD